MNHNEYAIEHEHEPPGMAFNVKNQQKTKIIFNYFIVVFFLFFS